MLSTFHNNTQKRQAHLAPVVKQEMKPNTTPPPTSPLATSNPILTSPLSPASLLPPPPAALTAEPAAVNMSPVIPSLPPTSTTESTATHAMPLVNDEMTLPTPSTMSIIPSPLLAPVTDSSEVTHATPLSSDMVNLPSSAALLSVSGPDASLVIPSAQQGVPLTPDGDSPLDGEELENQHNAALPARLVRPVGTRPLVNLLRSKHFRAPSGPSKRLMALRKVQDNKASQAKSASNAKVVDTPSKHGSFCYPYLLPASDSWVVAIDALISTVILITGWKLLLSFEMDFFYLGFVQLCSIGWDAGFLCGLMWFGCGVHLQFALVRFGSTWFNLPSPYFHWYSTTDSSLSTTRSKKVIGTPLAVAIRLIMLQQRCTGIHSALNLECTSRISRNIASSMAL
ncbi:uncharacterized protein LACBIDRAFT_333437 [Laccaria bicolor S238N-H82]|uniref:Predicted protein n=1 Tax=Laccaria bicolor (strain S238N-H82 / ATCC MYA-4686) TaxID=486041 RepID=B0DVW9_LACBS|nr:uncharacterized protein LACBIDRAFT_333437 [Laccaria bicolor S238N-H82]EDR01248.1 predicted protein [Laccaria bicolor S238N-H82]|eukprot:XP_001888124.1 predicted protein [Laccaria bicolor S238N-H82]